jgi:hypothetical protein
MRSLQIMIPGYHVPPPISWRVSNWLLQLLTPGESDPVVLGRLGTLKKSRLPRDILEPTDDERMPNPFQKLKTGTAPGNNPLKAYRALHNIELDASMLVVVTALNIMYFASIVSRSERKPSRHSSQQHFPTLASRGSRKKSVYRALFLS